MKYNDIIDNIRKVMKTNVANYTPTEDTDLTTKKYVEDIVEEGMSNVDLEEYAKLEDLVGKFDDVELNEEETTENQTALDFYSNGEVVKTIYFASGGGGGTASCYISTTLEENVTVETGQAFNLILDFSSPNAGKGTLKVFINDVDSMSVSVPQGETVNIIPFTLLSKGTNKMVVYVLDRKGQMSNSLTFYVRYGSTEITSTFDPYTSYDYGSTVRYYFTPTALDTSSTLTFYMMIDGVMQEGISCTSDVRSYYTFPTSLAVGSHQCEAWVNDGIYDSNVLKFNLVILDATSLVVATDTYNPTVEEGEQLSLDYKVYMKYNTSFIVKTYINSTLVNTGNCTLEMSYYKTSTLKEGVHTVKVEVWDVTETVSDYVTWTVTVTPSTYEMKQPVNTGSVFMASAMNKSNTDEGKEVWIGTNQDKEEIPATLTNFAFNSESGWVNDGLIISGNSWVEIPVAPLSNNAKYGFTLDIEFLSKQIGVEDAEVLTLWNDTDNCGIKITTEKLIVRSKEGNQCSLYFTDNEIVSAIFIIDRDEKVAKIYINGVMCEAFFLSDYTANGVDYLEDFTVESNVFLGGFNKNGYSIIKNIRIYEIALTTEEILNNFISNETDKSTQKELVNFQKGDHLPTVTVYCDFSGLGKDDKKPCNITYNSPNEYLYGSSFNLIGKTSQLQYQGTSSMAYPIKNYRLNLRDAKGNKWKYNPYRTGQPEARFTLKADFMSSGHWQNTGLAKWVNDNLYNYKADDEKSMNPMKWHLLQNGEDLNEVRETICGFPCRLILINDGETPLNEGQQEPTSGNTKDMGIFNFNNDKDNVATLGLDTKIFPNCISYEVTANSDTSAGAFIPYSEERVINAYIDGTWTHFNWCENNVDIWDNITLSVGTNTNQMRIIWYNSLGGSEYDMSNKTLGDTCDPQAKSYPYFNMAIFNIQPTTVTINGVDFTVNYVDSEEKLYEEMFSMQIDSNAELEYLQQSFELRYPDADDVGEDYGYLGIKTTVNKFDYYIQNGTTTWTTKILRDYFGTTTLSVPNAQDIVSYDSSEQASVIAVTNGVATLRDNTVKFCIRWADASSTTFVINGETYHLGNAVANGTIKDPYKEEGFSQEYGLKRVIDWVGNCSDGEFVRDFEKYFNKQYVFRYYLLVITLGMVDNLG